MKLPKGSFALILCAAQAAARQDITSRELQVDNTSEVVGLPNPASENCVEMNGTLETKFDSDGEYAVCVFDDGTACEEWALQRGECEKGSQPIFSFYCADNEGTMSTELVDWGDVEGAPAAEYQICTIGDIECTESSYYAGECTVEEVLLSTESTPMLGSDDDEFGCGGGSTGLEWCPELERCIQPWAETCAIDGDTYSGPAELTCDAGRCSSGDEKCEWTDGSATMASFYFANLDGAFEVPEGCTLTCTGCVLATDDDTSEVVGLPNPAAENCEQMNGTLEAKFDSDGEYAVCAFDDGTACEEWALQRGECEKGSQPIFSFYCADNEGTMSTESVDWGDVEGAPSAEYQICTIGDVECTESSYYAGNCTGGDVLDDEMEVETLEDLSASLSDDSNGAVASSIKISLFMTGSYLLSCWL